MGRAFFGRQLSENDLNALSLQVALDHTEMGNVSGKAVNIVDQDDMKNAFRGVVA
jgi:hypothetical protein